MMALAGNFDTRGGQNIGREPATGYDSFMFDVVPNQKGRMGQRRKETAMNIKKLSVCQNTGYQDILVADDATGELKTTKQNSGGQVIYGQQGGFGAEISATVADNHIVGTTVDDDTFHIRQSLQFGSGNVVRVDFTIYSQRTNRSGKHCVFVTSQIQNHNHILLHSSILFFKLIISVGLIPILLYWVVLKRCHRLRGSHLSPY